MKSIRLNNGVEMPILGLGLWNMDASEVLQAVDAALEAGYRLFDTATFYNNEAALGAALKASRIPREELFITTKLWASDFDDPAGAFSESLAKLRLEYVDLYLIHWPGAPTPHGVWQRLERIYDDKRARAIGISNYEVSDIEDLLTYARVRPAVNQVKFSPFDFRRNLLDYCEAQHIMLEAYSPLTRGRRLDDPAIREVATVYGKTPAQIMLRWCIEHGIVTIPKSTHPERIRENIDVFDFELAAGHMSVLDALT